MQARVRYGIATAGTPMAGLLLAALLALLVLPGSAFVLHSPSAARRALASPTASLHGRALPRAVAARLRPRVLLPPALGRLSCLGAQKAATAESPLLEEDTPDISDSAFSEVVGGAGDGDLSEESVVEEEEIPWSVALHGATLSEVGTAEHSSCTAS